MLLKYFIIVCIPVIAYGIAKSRGIKFEFPDKLQILNRWGRVEVKFLYSDDNSLDVTKDLQKHDLDIRKGVAPVKSKEKQPKEEEKKITFEWEEKKDGWRVRKVAS